MTRLAQESDDREAKKIADQHRNEFGFIPMSVFSESASKGCLAVAISNNLVVGFIRWHLRLDGVSTIYEVCVDPSYRRRGIGTELIKSIQQYSGPIRLKCPVHLDANQFYAAIGFKHQETLKGKRHPLNVWSST